MRSIFPTEEGSDGDLSEVDILSIVFFISSLSLESPAGFKLFAGFVITVRNLNSL